MKIFQTNEKWYFTYVTVIQVDSNIVLDPIKDSEKNPQLIQLNLIPDLRMIHNEIKID